MDNNFSIYWNPTSGKFKVFDSGYSWSVLNNLKPLSIELRDDGFIEFQFFRFCGGEE